MKKNNKSTLNCSIIFAHFFTFFLPFFERNIWQVIWSTSPAFCSHAVIQYSIYYPIKFIWTAVAYKNLVIQPTGSNIIVYLNVVLTSWSLSLSGWRCAATGGR